MRRRKFTELKRTHLFTMHLNTEAFEKKNKKKLHKTSALTNLNGSNFSALKVKYQLAAAA